MIASPNYTDHRNPYINLILKRKYGQTVQTKLETISENSDKTNFLIKVDQTRQLDQIQESPIRHTKVDLVQTQIQLSKKIKISDSTDLPAILQNFKTLPQTDCEFISNLKFVFECTFSTNTVYELFTNEHFVGIKCMVIANRDNERERLNPHLLLELDRLYSEERNEFKIMYILYTPKHDSAIIYYNSNPVYKKVFPENNITSTRGKINDILNFFRPVYINDFRNLDLCEKEEKQDQ